MSAFSQKVKWFTKYIIVGAALNNKFSYIFNGLEIPNKQAKRIGGTDYDDKQ